jgi:hypothetical protein
MVSYIGIGRVASAGTPRFFCKIAIPLCAKGVEFSATVESVASLDLSDPEHLVLIKEWCEMPMQIPA